MPITLLTGIAVALAAAVQVPGLSSDTKACRLMPNAELEAHFGAKPKSAPRGMDGDGLSTCTATVSAKNLDKLEVSPPGQVGVPTSIEMGLGAARMILGSNKGPLQLIDAKDFGNVGCFSSKATVKPQPPVFSTACFVVNGGYLVLTLTDADAERVRYDLVKPLVEK